MCVEGTQRHRNRDVTPANGQHPRSTRGATRSPKPGTSASPSSTSSFLSSEQWRWATSSLRGPRLSRHFLILCSRFASAPVSLESCPFLTPGREASPRFSSPPSYWTHRQASNFFVPVSNSWMLHVVGWVGSSVSSSPSPLYFCQREALLQPQPACMAPKSAA